MIGRNVELARLAARLGHSSVTVDRSARGLWFVSCTCGWVSTQSVKVEAATGAAVHHVRRQALEVEREARTLGISLDSAVERYRAESRTFTNSGAKPATV